MPGEARTNVAAGQVTLHVQTRNIQRVERKGVVVHDGVVPRRTRTVVAVISALHTGISREPPGVVVDAVTQTVPGVRTGFTVRDDAIAMTTRSDFMHLGRNVK